MRFDLIDLRLLLHIAETGSITRGAERSHMTLASASARVRAMEDSLGAPLLQRHAQGVRATDLGRIVLHHARGVAHQLDAMTLELGEYAGHGRQRVRLLGNTSALAWHLPGMLADYLAAQSDVDLEVEERPSHEIVARLRDGTHDLGILADSVDLGGLERRFFRADPLVVITAHRRAPHPAPATLSLADLIDEAFIGLPADSPLQRMIDAHAVRAGRLPRYRLRVLDLATVCELVAQDLGVAIIPAVVLERHPQRGQLRATPLDDAWAQRSLQICAARFSTLPPHVQALADTLCSS